MCCRVCLLSWPSGVAFLLRKGQCPSNSRLRRQKEERALRRYQELVLRSIVFRSNVEEPDEFPYGKMPEIINYNGMWEPVNRLDSAQLDEKFRRSNITDSVGMKGQLFNLLQQLENNIPHFVQCIRPNSNKLPGMFEDKLVLQQLRCCGVQEVVRMSRSGYHLE